MKNIHLFTAITGATMLVATSAFAGPYGNPDLESGILNDQDRPAYVGTGLPDARKRVYIGTPSEAFPNPDADETGYVVGTAGPEKGRGDEYGSILFDVGAMR